MRVLVGVIFPFFLDSFFFFSVAETIPYAVPEETKRFERRLTPFWVHPYR